MAQRGAHLVLPRQRADTELTKRLDVLTWQPPGATSVQPLRTLASDPPVWLHFSLLVPEQVSALDPFAIANILGLTPAQARVAARLAAGMTAEQIAAAHGITVNTVRTHTRQVMARLGAERVSQVVRTLRQGEALWAQAVPR